MDESDVESESKTHRDEIKKRKKKLRKLNRLLNRKKEAKKKPSKTSNHERKIQKFFCNPRETEKFLANKRLTTGRLKLQHTQEGIFMKGLRSQYIGREPLSEANEARKNEDLNKIIDIGRARILGRGPEISENDFKNSSRDCSKIPRDTKLQSVFNLIKSFEFDDFDDFERCPLSPIRNTSAEGSPVNSSPPASTQLFVPKKKLTIHDRKSKRVGIDFKKEFHKFVFLVEENCSSQILPKLPSKGVLECALESLKELRIDKLTKDEKVAQQTVSEKMKKTEFLSGFELIAKTQQSFPPLAQDNFFSSPVQPDHFQTSHNRSLFSIRYDATADFERSKNDLVFNGLTDLQLNTEGTNHISVPIFDLNPSPFFSSSTKNLPTDSAFQRDDSEETHKEFEFVTPPIHFYRRNMF